MTLNLFHFNIAKAAYAKDGKIFKERTGISFTHKSKRINEKCFTIAKKRNKRALNKGVWYNINVSALVKKRRFVSLWFRGESFCHFWNKENVWTGRKER